MRRDPRLHVAVRAPVDFAFIAGRPWADRLGAPAGPGPRRTTAAPRAPPPRTRADVATSGSAPEESIALPERKRLRLRRHRLG